MKVIWAKEKLQDFYYCGTEITEQMTRKVNSVNGSMKGRSWVTSRGARLEEAISNNTVILHARASGDGASASGRCCRLCGGERALRRLGDRCVWEGVEERYDQLLADCFAVRVYPADGLICDRCINQLRNTQKFRALVYAAFEKSCSECTSLQTAIVAVADESARTVRNCDLNETNQPDSHPIDDLIRNNKDQTVVNKKILELLTKKAVTGATNKKLVKKRSFANNNVAATKRVIVMCSVCGQRYPMMVPTDVNSKLFICSRCKLKKHREKSAFCRKCDVVMPASVMKEHMSLHAKPETRGKNRPNNLSKKPSLKNINSTAKTICHRKNYQVPTNKCPKKHLNAKNLVEHAKSAHGINLECVCSVCGKDLKTRYLLDQHLRLHAGETLYECDICKRVFKDRNALQLHYLTHEHFLPNN